MCIGFGRIFCRSRGVGGTDYSERVRLSQSRTLKSRLYHSTRVRLRQVELEKLGFSAESSILHRQRPKLENPEGRTEPRWRARTKRGGRVGAAGPVGGRSGQEPLHMRVDGVGVQRIGRGERAGAPHGHVYRDPAHTLFGTSPSIARGASRSCRPGGGRSGQEPLHMRVDSVAVKRIARGEGRAGRDDACENRTPTHSFWDVTFDREGGEPEPSGSSKRWIRYRDWF